MAKTIRYTIEFLRKAGCERGIVHDMARYDSGSIVDAQRDEDCHGDNFRRVTIEGKFEPTMARWASFAVGARRS